MIIPFEKMRDGDREFGGKAWGLGMLARRGFPIPPGVVLGGEPESGEWPELLKWWREQGSAPLAVRSSAAAEDSAETSFAGQNRTFLNVQDERTLRSAVHECFASLDRENCKAYHKFFASDETGRMNVVLQKMIAPQFAGVFFSDDPVSPGRGWVLEVVPGLGEDLVSGRVTPGQIRQDGMSRGLPAGFTAKHIQDVAAQGLAVRDSLGFPLDMEWAIDSADQVYVLQARPITARSSHKQDYVVREVERLERANGPATSWDGQTFAEWNGLPSRLTFSIWRRAFSPQHAFGSALRELGYRSFPSAGWQEGDSLLERVFGRAYVNLSRLSDLYYGAAPYRIELLPRPHTKFDGALLNRWSLMNFPAGTWNMVKVGWNLSTRRKFFYERCLQELSLFKHRFSRPDAGASLAALSTADLAQQIADEAEEFSARSLHWPLVLVILTEATLQNLRRLLTSVCGEAAADQGIREWMGKGLHTVLSDMQRDFAEASASPIVVRQ